MTEENPSKETMDEWHNDPSNWKWGVLYFNKKDKRIFVPKRQKFLGFTVNFANPNSLAAIIGLMLLIAITAKLSNRH